MYALLVTTLVLAQAPTPAPAESPDKAPTAKPGAAQSLDGNWTVVAYEKNGQPMAEAKDVTVMIKDNTVTFTPKDAKTKMVAIRLEFPQPGMIRATEMESGSGSGTPDKSDPNDKAAPAGKAGQAKQGVYVLAQDYLAICIHDAKGSGTGSGQTGDKEPVSKDQPATKDQPTGSDNKAGSGTGTSPISQSYCTVILKKSGGTERK